VIAIGSLCPDILGAVFHNVPSTVQSPRKCNGSRPQSAVAAAFAVRADGTCPEFLKERIAGDGGHLSNVEAADLLKPVAKGKIRWACLGHLSEQNNLPDLAIRTHRHVLGSCFPLVVASRYEAGKVLEV
jgi:hypothetical protein